MVKKTLASVAEELKIIAKTLGYPANPGNTGKHTSLMAIEETGANLDDFWQQYLALMALIDGFSIDGFSIYGLRSYRNEHNNFFEYNNGASRTNEPNTKESASLLLIGSTGTDLFVYDMSSERWEARDRIAIDEAYESYASLAELIESITLRIKNANQLE
ncbi:hypothetical protein PMPD1_0220 [Paramixta manurensis]|uniref:SMI1/KNR4 family protein n=1 Tax=Paramixta manurensis TaxID=2740817 RepID=A0A6M8UI64_9GAMM|nr:hypothetical protein PMPD1_0220 [Erwiniaceae bacterium PD-1]